MRISAHIALIVALGSIAFAVSSQAAERFPERAAERPPPKENPNANVIDRSHGFVSEYFARLGNEVDSFFSSQRGSYLTNNSEFRVFNVTTFRENEEPKNENQAAFSIVLPETEKRLRLIVERKPRRLESSPETPGNAVPKETLSEPRKTQTTAALRFVNVFTQETSITSDFGVQFDQPVQPFGRGRLRKSFFPNKTWELRFTEEVYYFFIDQWRLITGLDSDHDLTEKLLFRLGHELTWSQFTNNYDFLYGPSLFHMITPSIGMGYHFKVLARSTPVWQNTNMTATIVYRQLLYKDWFFWELIPAIDFPRTKDWTGTPYYSVKFEVVF